MSIEQFTRALTGSADRPALTFQRDYPTTADDLWSALTDPTRLGRWLGIVDGTPATVGDRFAVQLSADDPSDRAELTVLACQKPHELVLDWRWQGERPSSLTARLTALDESTRLTLTHQLGTPEHTVDYGGGWEDLLGGLAGLYGATPAAADAEQRSRDTWQALSVRALDVSIDLAAPPAQVWQSIATAEGLRRWWWTHWRDTQVETDVSPGGRLTITTPTHDITVTGEYLTVEPEQRLAHTWVWIDQDGSTVDEAVEYTLTAAGQGTQLTVRHTGPWPDGASAEDYRQGWNFVLGALQRSLSA